MTARRRQFPWQLIGVLTTLLLASIAAAIGYGGVRSDVDSCKVTLDKKVDVDRFEDLKGEVGIIRRGVDEILRRMPRGG